MERWDTEKVRDTPSSVKYGLVVATEITLLYSLVLS